MDASPTELVVSQPRPTINLPAGQRASVPARQRASAPARRQAGGPDSEEVPSARSSKLIQLKNIKQPAAASRPEVAERRHSRLRSIGKVDPSSTEECKLHGIQIPRNWGKQQGEN